MIQVFCVGCGKSLRAKDEWRGKKVHCRGCGTRFVVPREPLSVKASPEESLEASGSSGERPVVVVVPASAPPVTKRPAGAGLTRLGIGILVVAAIIFFGRESIAAYFGYLVGPAKVAEAPGPLSVPVAFLAICLGILGALFSGAGVIVSAVFGRRS